MAQQGYQEQPSVFELIDEYGVLQERPCGGCNERLLYKIHFDKDEWFWACSRCDVEHSKKA